VAIVVVTRWKADFQQVLPEARRGAATHKRHGATSFRIGPCYAGPDTDLVYLAVTYPDWEAYGRAVEALAADPEQQRHYGDATKIAQLVDRSVIVAEEL
jgi:hypothetical protein